MDSFQTLNTYAIYKAGQNKFTTWLKRRAAECTSTATKTPGKKTKSKHASILPSSNVLISELQGLANTVAEHLPAHEISYNMLNTLRDVIDRRRESARFFRNELENSSQLDSSLSVKNCGHLHMITVLEGVLKVLEKKAITDSKSEAKSLEKQEKLGNAFEKLELHQPNVEEDIDEDVLKALNPNSAVRKSGVGGKKVKKPSKPTKSTAPSSTNPLSDMEFVLVSDEFDTQFLIHCFLQDMNKIRDYLLERWCDYDQDGEVSLTSISITTNTAFDLFQRAEKSLQSQLPKGTVLENYENTIVKAFAADPFEELGRASSIAAAEVCYPSWGEEMYKKADWACLTVYQQLKSFLNNWVIDPIQENTPGIETPDRDYKRENLYGQTLETKISRNVVVLSQFLCEMCAHKKWKQTGMKVPVEDELQRGVIQMFKSKTLPLWLVFACQVYVDIRFVLEGNVDRAHQELTAVGSRLLSSLSSYEEFVPSHPDGIEPQILILKDEIARWADKADCIGIAARNELRAGFMMHAEPFFLLRRHPIFCGLLIFRLSWMMEELGLQVVNAWGAVRAGAHLWNAVRNEIQKTQPQRFNRLWQDMDWLIGIHEARWIFIGDAPTNPDDYSRRYELVTGMSVAMYSAKNSHSLKAGFSASRAPKGERPLYPKSHASRVISKRFCGPENSHQMLAGIEKMFQTVFDKNGRSFDSANSSDMSYVIFDDSSRRSTLIHQHYQQSQTLSPLQVLDMLCRTVHAERMHLSFDYLHIHQTSTLVLRGLCERFKDQLRLMSEDIGTPPIIQEHLGELPMMASIALGLISKARQSILRAEIVEPMAEVMEEAIGDEGSYCALSIQNVLNSGFPYGPKEPWTMEL